MPSEHESTNPTQVNTSGGTVVEGNVNTSGGDFIGRDKIVITEEAAYQVYGLTNPYLGLRAFHYEDRAIYAGREQLAQETVHRLTKPGAQQTLIFITGASGSGKSSFAQAGLIPLLESHYATYQKTVRHAIMRPSGQPMVMLADALQKLHPTLTPSTLGTNTPIAQINLLLIDQFEELFIQSDASQRAPFCDFLINLPDFTTSHTHILITLRVDYLDELFAIQPLWAIAKEGVELRAMSADDLRNAIQKPLQVHHPQKRFAPELLDRLVQDGGADAALLPLLQVTLAELWKTGKLVLSNYHSLTNAIRQRAEMVYAFSDHTNADPKTPRPAQVQQALMGILLDLINVSVDGADRRDARQRRTRQELEQGSAQRPRLIEELVNARLLAAARETRNGEDVEVIDIIHESLIDNWERLRDAIDEQRQQLQRRARFKLWLGEWVRSERKDGYLLLTDMQLAEAQVLVEGRDIEAQGVDAQEFYQRSIEYHEAEQQKELQQVRELAEAQRRRAQTFRWATVVAISLTLLSLAATGFAMLQTRRATESLRVSNAEKLAAHALRVLSSNEPVGDIGLLLARESVLATLSTDGYITPNADSALRKAISNSSWRQTIPAYRHTDDITSAAFSPDGKSFVSASRDSKLILWNTETGQGIRIFRGHEGGVSSVAFHPDGRSIASASRWDKTIHIWDVETGKSLKVFKIDSFLSSPDVIFSPNGKLLAASYDDGERGWITIWSFPSGNEIHSLELNTKGSGPIDFSVDSKTLVAQSSRGIISMWEVQSGKVLQSFAGQDSEITLVNFSADGQKLLSVSFRSNVVQIWDVKTRKNIQTFSVQYPNYAALDPRSQYLASIGSDDLIHLWDVTSGKLIRSFDSPLTYEKYQNVILFSPSGEYLLSGGADQSLLLWDVQSGTVINTYGGHTDMVNSIDSSPDDKLIVSGSEDGEIRVWEIDTGYLLYTLYGHEGAITDVAFSPDGKYIVSAGKDDTIRVWDQFTGKQILGFRGRIFGGANSVSFSKDGSIIVAGGGGNVRLWEATTGELLRSFSYTHTILSMTYSESQDLLAASTADGKILLWSTKYEAPKSPQYLLGHTGAIHYVDFSSNGNLLVSSGEDGSVRLWNMSSKTPLHTFLGHTKPVLSVEFSPDNTQIVSASKDGTARLWDIKDLTIIRKMSHDNMQFHDQYGRSTEITQARFSSDGQTIITASEDHSIRLWDVEIDEPVSIFTGYESDAFAISPDETLIASCNYDEDLHLRDFSSGQALSLSQGYQHFYCSSSMVFSPDSKMMATGTDEGFVDLWNVETREKIRSIQHYVEGGRKEISDIDFSTDGKLLVSVGGAILTISETETGRLVHQVSLMASYLAVKFSPDNKLIAASISSLLGVSNSAVVIWRIDNGEKVTSFSNAREPIVFSPDSKLIAFANNDNIIYIHDISSGKLIQTLKGHTDRISAISFLPDGKILVSSSDDQTIILWNIEQGIALTTLLGHTDSVNAIAITSDGRKIVSAGSDQTVRVWLADVDELLAIAEKRIQRSSPFFTNDEARTYGIDQ